MIEKGFIGAIKRNKNIIVLIAVVVFLIVIVIIMSNRMIMQIERNALSYVLRYTPTSLSTSLIDEPGSHSDFLSIHKKYF